MDKEFEWPFIGKEEIKQKRKEFEKLKNTKAFKDFIYKQLEKQEDKCCYCTRILYEFIDTGFHWIAPGIPGSRYAFKNYDYHIDHKIPLAKGGYQ